MPKDHPFEMNTDKFTELSSKFAVFIMIYLSRKIEIFLRAFLIDVCGVAPKESIHDWSSTDRSALSYYFYRAEYGSVRGSVHYHSLIKLLNVLDTGLLGRMIHNSRLVREELKCGNIVEEKKEEAWRIVEMGLLASRYVVLFADRISRCSFYTEELGSGVHDPSKVIDVEKLRQEFVSN